MMRPSILLLLLAAACTNDSLDYPQVADPTPWNAPRDDRIATSTGLDTLPLGDPVGVEFTLEGYAQFLWVLTVPPGSLAALSDPGAPKPVFTPDVAGDYAVEVTAADAFGGAVQTASRRFYGGTYLGQAACAQCHGDTEAEVRLTEHASVFERAGPAIFSGGAGCFACHVVDPVPSPAPPPSGSFGEAAAAEGLDPATYAYTTFTQFALDYPQSAARANVQCENCHGPGSQHNGDPRRISVPLRSIVCGICHTGVVGPNVRVQWENSAHGNDPPAAAVADPSCRRCHTAAGFIDTVEGRPPREITAGAPGQTCAACHNPHSATLPFQIRIFGTVTVGGGDAYNGGRAAACLVCHQSGVQDPQAYALANNGPPCATQSDMIATRGSVEYDGAYSASFHAGTSFRLRSFTGDPDDSDTPDSCVICHMDDGPAGPLAEELGGHTVTMRSGAEINITACTPCHATLTTFDRTARGDYDGDGTIDGVQTEVRRLLANLASAIFAADTGGAVTQPGGPTTPMLVAPGIATTAALREAVFNYNFVAIDGSFGIHNTSYAVQILQRTYGALTGVPYATAFPDALIR
ncbi:MAG TPA: hypothetical protein VFY93_03980 [Planctomycetota bacterium]|nr:hypothetical protein [Planctomycetota bacterium]